MDRPTNLPSYRDAQNFDPPNDCCEENHIYIENKLVTPTKLVLEGLTDRPIVGQTDRWTDQPTDDPCYREIQERI